MKNKYTKETLYWGLFLVCLALTATSFIWYFMLWPSIIASFVFLLVSFAGILLTTTESGETEQATAAEPVIETGKAAEEEKGGKEKGKTDKAAQKKIKEQEKTITDLNAELDKAKKLIGEVQGKLNVQSQELENTKLTLTKSAQTSMENLKAGHEQELSTKMRSHQAELETIKKDRALFVRIFNQMNDESNPRLKILKTYCMMYDMYDEFEGRGTNRPNMQLLAGKKYADLQNEAQKIPLHNYSPEHKEIVSICQDKKITQEEINFFFKNFYINVEAEVNGDTV